MRVSDIEPNDALRMMIDSSGKSGYRVSLDLGRSRNWVSNSLGRDPKLGTVAAVADITGHEVAILDAETQEIVAKVRPPKPKGESESA